MIDPLSAEIAEALLDVRSPTFGDAIRLTRKRLPVATDEYRTRVANGAAYVYYDTLSIIKRVLYGKI